MDWSGASRDPKGRCERIATDAELFGSVVHPRDSVAKAVRKEAASTSGTAVVGIVGTAVEDVRSVEDSSPICPVGTGPSPRPKSGTARRALSAPGPRPRSDSRSLIPRRSRARRNRRCSRTGPGVSDARRRTQAVPASRGGRGCARRSGGAGSIRSGGWTRPPASGPTARKDRAPRVRSSRGEDPTRECLAGTDRLRSNAPVSVSRAAGGRPLGWPIGFRRGASGRDDPRTAAGPPATAAWDGRVRRCRLRIPRTGAPVGCQAGDPDFSVTPAGEPMGEPTRRLGSPPAAGWGWGGWTGMPWWRSPVWRGIGADGLF